MDRLKSIVHEILQTYLDEQRDFDAISDGYFEQNKQYREDLRLEFTFRIDESSDADELQVIADELLTLYEATCSTKIRNANGYEKHMQRECDQTVSGYRTRMQEAIQAAAMPAA